jgi:hypothetical protein
LGDLRDMNLVDYRTGQGVFPFAPAPRYRLQQIEDILRKTQAFGKTPPSRATLQALCEDGTLDAKLTSFGWLVTQESFWIWLRSINEEIPVAA